MSGMFKQKLSFRTQMVLVELLADVKASAVDADPEALNKWTGEFIMWYSDEDRYPRLAIYMDHSIPAKADGSTSGASFGQWWTRSEDGLVADESLDFLMRG